MMKKLDHVNNNDEDFRKSAMHAYFNNDFKNSNFYKYMENMQKLNIYKFNETQMFKYFDNDFENTRFFKYLESLKNVEDLDDDFNKTLNDYFNSEFRNSNFVKYLDELKKADDLLDEGFTKSVMYNFFNKDFDKLSEPELQTTIDMKS
ncbi:unnamed protein product [Phaedon cochleariae]|uniref:Uncharacterized protein n=1 Tax=Phaedon cochleariae TaxID=80249 RepID=A0A9N9X2L3_PHACE|nr:unnamed protein product [Phaedon cochleariae]